MVKRVLVGYGIDVHAVSGWLSKKDGTPANPTDVSRGIFGATVGIDRLLKLWDKHNIKATWVVPGHSLEMRDAGHELALHGYTHEVVSTLSEDQQRDVLTRSIETMTSFLGKKPKGWTAPCWSTSPDTVRLLEEHGIEYDHSFMHHDSQPYYLPYEAKTIPTDTSKRAAHWMQPMSILKPSSVVSGKPQVMLMHERIINWINEHEGVEWCTMEEMVKEFTEGRLNGASVEGGVDI